MYTQHSPLIKRALSSRNLNSAVARHALPSRVLYATSGSQTKNCQGRGITSSRRSVNINKMIPISTSTTHKRPFIHTTNPVLPNQQSLYLTKLSQGSKQHFISIRSREHHFFQSKKNPTNPKFTKPQQQQHRRYFSPHLRLTNKPADNNIMNRSTDNNITNWSIDNRIPDAFSSRRALTMSIETPDSINAPSPPNPPTSQHLYKDLERHCEAHIETLARLNSVKLSGPLQFGLRSDCEILKISENEGLIFVEIDSLVAIEQGAHKFLLVLSKASERDLVATYAANTDGFDLVRVLDPQLEAQLPRQLVYKGFDLVDQPVRGKKVARFVRQQEAQFPTNTPIFTSPLLGVAHQETKIRVTEEELANLLQEFGPKKIDLEYSSLAPEVSSEEEDAQPYGDQVELHKVNTPSLIDDLVKFLSTSKPLRKAHQKPTARPAPDAPQVPREATVSSAETSASTGNQNSVSGHNLEVPKEAPVQRRVISNPLSQLIEFTDQSLQSDSVDFATAFHNIKDAQGPERLEVLRSLAQQINNNIALDEIEQLLRLFHYDTDKGAALAVLAKNKKLEDDLDLSWLPKDVFDAYHEELRLRWVFPKN